MPIEVGMRGRGAVLVVHVAVAAPIVVGCSVRSWEGEVRSRHAGEFHCQVDDVSIYEHGYATYEARGCGYRAMYACVNYACVRDSAPEPLAVNPSTQPRQPTQQTPEQVIHEGLAGRHSLILQCTGGSPTTVVAAYDANGAVHFSLAGPHGGTPAEACVRHGLGRVSIAGNGLSGAVTHDVTP